jgi:hypothetical protein
MAKFSTLLTTALTAICLCVFGQAAGTVNALGPVGTWDVTITPDDVERQPFHGLSTYNFGGTLTTSNTTCNSIAPSPSGNFCSEGYGVWRRVSWHRFVHTFYLELHNQAGEHLGFVKVRGVFVMEGKNRITGHNEGFLLIGTDLEDPFDVIPLGLESLEGRRILPELPSE